MDKKNHLTANTMSHMNFGLYFAREHETKKRLNHERIAQQYLQDRNRLIQDRLAEGLKYRPSLLFRIRSFFFSFFNH
jgi:hypothetical protein